MNKLLKGNLVRGLPSKIFKNDYTYVACQKGKQHKATCKAKLMSSIIQPLWMLHMDLFGPTSVMSINHKKYCLVVTDDFSRFSWMFFLASKDETSKAEAVNTACYILNRDLVTKTHNKTLYELLNGNQTNKNAGPQNTNGNAGTQDNVNSRKEVFDQHYIVLPLWSSISSTFKSSDEKATDDKPTDDTGLKTVEEPVNKEDQAYRDKLDRLTSQERRLSSVNAASTSGTFSAAGLSSPHPDAFIPTNTLLYVDQDDSQIPNLEDTAEL
nr:ribonuclease H-like domain-containing protein [Tanacetum cinerariifolium]